LVLDMAHDHYKDRLPTPEYLLQAHQS
jgi:hypothetical protein